MKKRLLNLLIKYTQCSVSINDGKISLEWTWQGNSLRWDSLVPDGMPITLRDGNMKAMECISLRGRLPHECKSKSSADLQESKR